MKKLIFAFFLTLSSLLSTSFAKDTTKEKSEIFQSIMSVRCEKYNQGLDKDAAYDITLLVMKKEANLENFKTAFKKSCDYNEALTIATDKEFGTKRLEAFGQIVFMQCDDKSNYMTLEHSRTIAQAAVQNTLKLDTFIAKFKASCNVELSEALSSLEVVNSITSL